MTLRDIALHTIQQNGLIPAGSMVVAGVSGGPDSLALLHVLRQLTAVLGFQLHAATFDHQLRGESSAADARFVEQMAQAWGIPVSIGRADVRQQAQAQGLGIEVAARQARYHFLASVARNVGATRVAVAHHADDQAETVLMHIIRGTGIEGLGGMGLQSVIPGHPDIALIRPFLKVERAQIEAYCRENDLHPRQDVTNQDIALLRNYIRWETLPHLEKLNPNIRRALIQLADIASVERAYLEQQLRQATHAAVENGRIIVGRAVFRALHPALQRRFVYWAAQQVARDSADTGYRHIIAAVEVALRGKVGALALLSSGLRLRVDYETLVIERDDAPPAFPVDLPLIDAGTEVKVAVPGLTPFPGGRWTLHVSTMPEESMKARLVIPEGSDVILRTRREGDRFAPLGMDGHRQKVGRWMINRKIPKAIRDCVPLLVVNGQIAAILGGAEWAISETFAVKDDSQQALYFTLREGEAS